MRFITVLIIALLLNGCRFTKNRLTVDRFELEDCCCYYFYYPKKDTHWSETGATEVYTRSWKIRYGFLSRKIATECIVKKDTILIYNYNKAGQILAKETQVGGRIIAYDCYVKYDSLKSPTNR